MAPILKISPPLLNSATPWATSLEELIPLFTSPSTGAVTTRTTLLNGFDHQHASHQYLFFDPATSVPNDGTSSTPAPPDGHTDEASASLNTLGYSPIPLEGYLSFLLELAHKYPQIRKTVIISVTGSPEDISRCYVSIEAATRGVPLPLAMEINLSCPNILDSPPPAYDGVALTKYLSVLPDQPTVPIGIKIPPYTYQGQFSMLVSALKPVSSSLSFLTATNTLGSCLILESDLQDGGRPQLPGSGVGGMAGPPLHPLALGNVATIRKLLDQEPETRHIQIIGVGGVRDGEGYRRMRAVGAAAVAIGTALGKQGPAVFQRIEKDLMGNW
ncbi:hypothetical protein BGZ63DRAFT_428855 [Mariannaea sp. PMI_226]|nr:hypothetical protein BGZ63DRAFT_428855 [Mariannaea sp. PMI_226]